MKRVVITIVLAATAIVQTAAQIVTVSVTSPGDRQRQEVVELSDQDVCRRLGISRDSGIVVTNTIGQEQVWQRTYDGRLLVDVAVQPHQTATYVIRKGQPTAFSWSVRGKVHPERADDLTWENDRGIYRMYGPALQRAGEKAFGTDVWVKNTPELVVEARYRQHLWGVGQRDSLNRIGRKKDANAVYMATSFHHDHGQGLDCYAVGQSLGCGAPGLMRDGQLIFPYCWKDCVIRDNGPLRFTAELTYGKTADGITEHRLVSLDKGAHFNRMTVSYEGITEPLTLATGVVLHGEDHLRLGSDYVLYADPTEKPALHQSQIYVGVLFPGSSARHAIHIARQQSHGLGMLYPYKGEPYTYYFGSVWSRYDVQTLEQWQLCTESFLQDIKNPLIIVLE